MRQSLRHIASLAFLGVTAVAWLGLPSHVHAQGRGGGGGGQDQGDDDAKKKKHDEEWGSNQKNLSLPQLRNAGPCPYVKVLYDAARYIELKDNRPTASSVGYTGEIDGLSSACEYKNDQPIHVQARLLFALGRGPQAAGSEHIYRYWIAVTDRNRAVLQKQEFDLPVVFKPGEDRVTKTEDVLGIVIPRADLKVSGANFEVLVGFDVTPEMASFNREGERFRVNAGETTASR